MQRLIGRLLLGSVLLCASLPALADAVTDRARAIIAGRPYARKDELAQREIVSQSVYDDVRDRITVGRP